MRALFLGCLLAGLFAFFGPENAAAQAPTFDLALACGASATGGRSQVNATAVDAAGNVYVAGQFADQVQFGPTVLTSASPGIDDLFVAKLNANGQYLWAVRAGGGNLDLAYGLAVDAAGNVYLTGYFRDTALFGGTSLTSAGVSGSSAPPDVFVAKLNAAGQWLWAVRGGGDRSDRGTDVQVDAAGNVYCCGFFRGDAATFGPFTLPLPALDPSDAFAAKLDANGQWLWVVRAGGTGQDVADALAVDGSGNAYVTGTFRSATADFGPVTLTNAGAPTTGGLFVAKLGPSGTWLWTQGNSGTAAFATCQVATGTGGHVYVAGSVSGTGAGLGGVPVLPQGGQDVFLAQLDAAGAWRGVHTAGGTGDDYCTALVLDGQDAAYLAGRFQGAADFGPTRLVSAGQEDVFVARLTPAGAWHWAQRGGGANPDIATSLALGPSGTPYLGGFFWDGSTQFGPVALTGTVATRPYGTGFLARLGGTPLAVAAPQEAGLTFWPTPARGHVQVHGVAPGQPVQVLDALGRVVSAHVLPTDGRLPLPGAAGLYIVRSGTQRRRLVVE